MFLQKWLLGRRSDGGEATAPTTDATAVEAPADLGLDRPGAVARTAAESPRDFAATSRAAATASA